MDPTRNRTREILIQRPQVTEIVKRKKMYFNIISLYQPTVGHRSHFKIKLFLYISYSKTHLFNKTDRQ